MTADLSDPQPPRLELVNITKRFGSFVANENVSLKLDPDTFHALLGENGAGKSSLVKCIMGYHLADAGDIIVGQSVRQIRSPYDAHKLGIGMVYQPCCGLSTVLRWLGNAGGSTGVESVRTAATGSTGLT
jgi:ABC-type uncharacterized transport system ATPase subunit